MRGPHFASTARRFTFRLGVSMSLSVVKSSPMSAKSFTSSKPLNLAPYVSSSFLKSARTFGFFTYGEFARTKSVAGVHNATLAAIATVAEYGNGWHHVISRNHALVLELRDRLAEGLGASALAGDDDVGTMASVAIELPPNTKALDLEMRLLADGWEVPIVGFHAGPLVRISAHLYNHADQATALAKKLRSVGVTGRTL